MTEKLPVNLINEVQKEISNLDPNPYYLTAYKDAECNYWSHIPGWIYKDYKNKEVQKVLDIGCAYGTLALYCLKLFQCRIYCIDFMEVYLSNSLIDRYRFNFKLNNIELDLFPWNGEKFDLILFTEVIEHFNFHPLPTLLKIKSLLKENGILYLSTPDAKTCGRVTKYYRAMHEIPFPKPGLPIVDDHVYVYNKHELMSLFKAAGFEVIRFDTTPAYGEGNFTHFNVALGNIMG